MVEPVLGSAHHVVGILESMPRDFGKNTKQSQIYRIIRAVYVFFRGGDHSLEVLCKKRQVPYNFIWKGNTREAADWVRSLSPDLIFVFGMSQLLGSDIISVPPFGVVNLHPSYLPNYRGPNPDFWQYYYTELYPGVTVHYVDEGEDTGEIIFQERLRVPLGSKSPEQLDRLIGELGVALALKAFDAIASGSAPRTLQPEKSPTPRARNLKLEEHSLLIDWDSWPIERIWHLLRGTEGWLNAIEQPRGLYIGQRWSIDEFEKISEISGNPGSIIKRNGRPCLLVGGGGIYLSIKFSLVRTVLHFLAK